MKNIFERYRALPQKNQLGIALLVFIIILILLPNTIAYALGAVASYKLIERRAWKYTAVSILAVVTFFSGVLWIVGDTPTITTENSIEKQEVVVAQGAQQEQEVDTSNNETDESTGPNEQVSVTDEVRTQPTGENTQQAQVANKSNLHKVVEVVDGDTVKLSIDGKTETIRLIGLDTPETVHPSKPVECFGVEASNKAKQLLSGKTVSLETDASQDTRDRYGRLLGYIILSDGTNFNKLMIEQGYAYEYTYSTAYKYQTAFKSAEQYARTNGIGLWADGVCEEETTTTQNNEPVTSSGSKWYVSSHYTSKYYYCEESDGWKSLSESYLKVYSSEASLRADFPSHTLHDSCQ